MRKFISIFLCVLMIATSMLFVGCSKEPADANTESDVNASAENVKFGLGLYNAVSKATDADGEVNGQGEIAITAAAVMLDADGKIVKCVIDTADNTVDYTADGKAISAESFLTKYELGDNYNMKLYGGATKEWYEQVDAFSALVVGKTADEVKALVAEGNKGTEEVVNAGCTIMIADFVYALDAAISNAVDSVAVADNELKLGMYTEQTTKDATEDADGQNKLETTVFAAAVDADGKIVASTNDCVQVVFTFDQKGASTYDTTADVVSKKVKGEAYGMSLYGTDLNGDGEVKEWFEQSAAFDAVCAGKTAGDVEELLTDNNYGSEELQSAGCTILVNGLVKAAAKIG